MTNLDIIQMLRRYYEGLFPKMCHNCGRCFFTLREYILNTNRLWPTSELDAEMENFEPVHPFGTMSMANCRCGSTLALSSKDLPVSQNRLLLEWYQVEMIRVGLDERELSDYLRDEIRKQALSPATAAVSPS
jgi:hypothetical protein